MAYEVVMDRVIAPHRYTESTGAIADHSTPEDELAVNERGAPLEAFRILGRGDVLYQSEADLNSLSDEKKQKAGELMFVQNTRYLNEHVKLGSIKELEAEKPVQAAPADSGAPEDKSASRRGGSKRGAASSAGDQ